MTNRVWEKTYKIIMTDMAGTKKEEIFPGVFGFHENLFYTMEPSGKRWCFNK